MLDKIISGGQSGADRAGWRAAKTFGLSSGGWMPTGFLTEDGPHPEIAGQYGAAELPTDSAIDQTEQNVQASDATLWFGATTTVGRPGDSRGVSPVHQAMHANLSGRVVRAVARRNLDRRKQDQDVERGRQPRARTARDRGSRRTLPRRGPATARSRTGLIPLRRLRLTARPCDPVPLPGMAWQVWLGQGGAQRNAPRCTGPHSGARVAMATLCPRHPT